MTSFDEWVESHRAQLAPIPKPLWKALFRKLTWSSEPDELALLKASHDSWSVAFNGAAGEELGPGSHIFVLEHVLSFPEERLRETLEQAPPQTIAPVRAVLARRGLDVASTDALMRAVWLAASAYVMTVLDDQGKQKQTYTWYLPAEQLLNMPHSETPNMACHLFFDLYSMKPLSLCWPLKRIAAGEECTRDYLAASTDRKERSALLFSWLQHSELPDPSLVQKLKSLAALRRPDPQSATASAPATSASSAKTADHRDTLPVKPHYLVYSPDIAPLLIKSSLDNSRFSLTSDPDAADIIWVAAPYDRTKLKPHQFLNQIANQNTLAVKDLLQAAIYKHWGIARAEGWYPRSFNLNSETLGFIGEYLNCQESQPDSNVWIVKPWNGTRSQGITVSNHLPEILKQLTTGPKLVAKYIHPPALLDGTTKFDLRVLVVVDSVSPLRIYTVPSVIYAREGNNTYDMDLTHLDSFESHYTVMGYRNLSVKRSSRSDLVRRIEACAAPDKPVSFDTDVLPRILDVVRKGVEAGLAGADAASVRAKTVLGADVMLDAAMNPWLIEFSSVPDTGRVLEQWPTLYGDLFEFLFCTDARPSDAFGHAFVAF
ncbi:tubulin-tyrosine ligase family-domain-containing protein [Entophlyctis helioformis]|nr:tubulin-tyrosine ligase family-domain-containing protein [Entophlyctis helioformis]